MKIDKMQDVVTLLTETINNLRTGKISQKSGSSIGYLSFVLLMAMDKADAQNEKDRIAKLKSEGKWQPEPYISPKVYIYKDEFYLDKDGNQLIVENNGKNYYHPQDFKKETDCGPFIPLESRRKEREKD